MKNFFWIIGLIIGLWVAPAIAGPCDSLDTRGLSDQAAIAVKQSCVTAMSPASTETEQLAEYADLGKKYGVALSEAAKSIGSTVNDLALTPVGMFVLILVGWKVIGSSLIGILSGIVWFTVMLPVWLIFFNKLVLKRLVTVRETLNDKGKVIARTKSPNEWGEAAGVTAFVMLFVLVAICISGFVMLF